MSTFNTLMAKIARLAKADEIYVRHTFKIWRMIAGEMHKLLVHLDDGSPAANEVFRWHCEVVTLDGRVLATGNGGATAEEALMSVHWNKLAER
jgi:hypothetical protein